MKAFLIILCALLTSCASQQPDFNSRMQSYIGLSSGELNKRLGSPDISYQDAQQTTLIYTPISYEIQIPTDLKIATTQSTIFASAGPVVISTPPITKTIYANCQVYFHLQNDIAQSWYAEGKECPLPSKK